MITFSVRNQESSTSNTYRLNILSCKKNLYSSGNQLNPVTQSLGLITVDLQIEEALANIVYVFIVPDSTQPVDLLVGGPFLDLPHVAYARIGEELRIGYVKDYQFLNLHIVKATPCIESKAAETARSERIKVKEENKKQIEN
ncbi:hypothetical protein NPIL_631061 [Nephila pilipes]|uniref:Uncharacterized protein n=1 Tax=Nephila pilipes TaxID=299642 RepID=A0A8X6QXH6_NEPPI|nr:hypothetical protein NPIL_631061 [Nephila pilipes]